MSIACTCTCIGWLIEIEHVLWLKACCKYTVFLLLISTYAFFVDRPINEVINISSIFNKIILTILYSIILCVHIVLNLIIFCSNLFQCIYF